MTDALRLRAWLALLRAPGIGPVTAAQLLERFGAPEAVLDAGPLQWQAAGLTREQSRGLRERDEAAITADLAWLAGAPRRAFVALDDPRYPPQLRATAHAPVGLFCQGDADLLALPQLAIVGARSSTPQGNENAKAFAAELSRRGLVITSGLALGIDGAAHRGALDADGYTIAVCGTGLDRVYPARHRDLAHRITERGLLVSEFPPGVPALAENFPRRNRIISGLALGVLVVEAARESGSLITARLAAEQGREVFAIPGSIHNPMARGCHALLRQGAKLVEQAEDILEELGPRIGAHLRAAPLRSADAQAATPGEPVGDAAQRALLVALGDDTLPHDTLFERAALPVEAFNTALLALELRGDIAAAAGGRYARVRRS